MTTDYTCFGFQRSVIWHDVKDILPAREAKVLVCFEVGASRVDVAEYGFDKTAGYYGFLYDGPFGDAEQIGITHWAYFPAPPAPRSIEEWKRRDKQ